MTTNKYVDLNESKFINISGNDKSEFLQSIITNDINKCVQKNGIYSCLLSPQGKFLADFFIYQKEDQYLIEINERFKNDFLNKLSIYKLRSNIDIKENNNYNSIVILNNDLKLNEGIINFTDPRNDNLGKKIFANKNDIVKIIEQNNLTKINFDFYRELMIKNIIPYSVMDLVVNKSLLLENNFEKINAIDWEKGCYVGQEITARMKYRSLLKKNIRALKILSGEISINSKVFLNNNEIGEILSFTKNFAMAMIKIVDAKKIIEYDKILNSEKAKLKIIG